MLTRTISSSTIFLFFTLSLFCQPDLTLWRVDGSAPHDHVSAEFYACGSQYYAVGEGPDVESISSWSIGNDGDAELVFELPLRFEGASERFTVVEQPTTNTLQPGEEVFFEIRYEQIEIDAFAFLVLNSNDPTEQNCSYAFDGGSIGDPDIPPLCVCDGNNEVVIIDIFGEGIVGGIFIGGGLSDIDCPAEGTPCQPISLDDPTDCSQLITTPEGVDLFRDVLTITSIPNAPPIFVLTANNNSDGFLDMDGNPYASPTFFVVEGFGAADESVNFVQSLTMVAPGVFELPFYRAPGSTVDIALSGTPFMSDSAAPTLESCQASAIPTVSEWGVMILALILLLFGIVLIRNRALTSQTA